MKNIPNTHLNLLPNTQSHFVSFSTDLYQVMSNTNGALSIYAGLYNKFKDYKEASKLSLYKTMAAEFIQSDMLDPVQKQELDKIIESEYGYFQEIFDAKKENKFNTLHQLQYGFVTALYHALGKRDQIPHTTSSRGDNTYTSTQTKLLPSYNVIGHGGPHS